MTEAEKREELIELLAEKASLDLIEAQDAADAILARYRLTRLEV